MMAMTKKEREAHEEALYQARMLGALRWTSEVKEDVPPPKDSDKLATGWLPIGSRVEVACSSSVFHARGRNDRTTTQNPRHLFSTKLLALRALRHEIEIECARKLAEIDRQIAAEVQP